MGWGERLIERVRRGGVAGLRGAFIALVLSVLLGILLWRFADDVALAQRERAGARLIGHVYVAIDAVQRHRDHGVALLDVALGASERLVALHKDAELALQQVDVLLPARLHQSARWQAVQTDWEDIARDGAEWTRFEYFRRHTELVEQLNALLVDVADESELSLDAYLDTYYLQDMLVNRMPPLQESLSRLRAVGAFGLARHQLVDETREFARATMGQMVEHRRVQVAGFERLSRAMPEQAEALRQAQSKIEAGIDSVLFLMEADVLSGRFVGNPPQFFGEVSEPIALVHDLAVRTFQRELQRRLDERITWTLVQGGALLLTALLALLSLTRLVRAVLLRAAQLAAANEALSDENARRRETEAELRVSMEAAVQANRAKTQFLANLSHEVRTPLHGMLGMAEVLAMSQLDEEQTQLLREMVGSGKSLQAMLDRLIDYTHIEAGEVTLSQGPFAPLDMAERVAARHAAAAAVKGIRLVVRADGAVSDIVVGDERRLQQALECLVDNAVKFTEQGVVDIALTEAPDGESAVRLQFAVSDTGIGVPADKRVMIFESFTQADGTMTRRAGGNGLGLAIARRLAQSMGGALTHADRPGGGSVFTLTVRLARFGDD